MSFFTLTFHLSPLTFFLCLILNFSSLSNQSLSDSRLFTSTFQEQLHFIMMIIIVILRPSRVMNQSGSGALRINQSSTNRRSVNASVGRRSFSLARDSKVLDKGSIQPPKHTVQVIAITPWPLCVSELRLYFSLKPLFNNVFAGFLLRCLMKRGRTSLLSLCTS